MKRLLFLSMLAVGIILCSAQYTFALSDGDYIKYKQESVKFALADKDLGHTWKMIKGMNGGKIPDALMTEQKQWIQVERDTEAQKLFSTMSPADAYAAVTNQRIEVLRAKWLVGNPSPGTPNPPSNQGRESVADISGEYFSLSSDGQIDDRDDYNKVVIVKYNDEYIVEVKVASPRGSCQFKGRGRLKDNTIYAIAFEGNEEKIPSSTEKYILPFIINGNTVETKDDNNLWESDKIFCGGMVPPGLEVKFQKKDKNYKRIEKKDTIIGRIKDSNGGHVLEDKKTGKELPIIDWHYMSPSMQECVMMYQDGKHRGYFEITIDKTVHTSDDYDVIGHGHDTCKPVK